MIALKRCQPYMRLTVQQLRTITITTSNYLIQGRAMYMEDRIKIGHENKVVAVFDGHGMQQTSDRLHKDFLGSKQMRKIDVSKSVSNETIINGITETLTDIGSRMKSVGAWGGSTAAISYISQKSDENQASIITVNVGDSRVVLSRNKVAIDLTVDHTPNNPIERERIEKLGGSVDLIDGVWRVQKRLGVSRSIGDLDLSPYVSNEVDTKVYPITKDDEFVIVASDGLWDVMSSQDVVDFIQEELNTINALIQTHFETKDFPSLPSDLIKRGDRFVKTCSEREIRIYFMRDIAEKLVRFAYSDLKSQDNISVVIQWIDHTVTVSEEYNEEYSSDHILCGSNKKLK